MTGQTVSWTREKFIILCDAYKANKHAPSFTITLKPEGDVTFVPDYAAYLIEYLDEQFKQPEPARQPSNEGEQSYTPGSGSWEGEGRRQ